MGGITGLGAKSNTDSRGARSRSRGSKQRKATKPKRNDSNLRKNCKQSKKFG